jgi:hypothetical protein
MVGNNLTVTGITIPNNMSYPMKIDITGIAAIEDSPIGKFDSGAHTLAPGGSIPLDIALGLNFSQALHDSSVFRKALLNGSSLLINASIDASVFPIIGLNVTQAVNQTMPAVLGNLSTTIDPSKVTLSSDYTQVIVPVELSWTNGSPFQFAGNLNVVLTGIPGKPTGNYASGGGAFSLVPGPNQDTVTFKIPLSDFSGNNNGLPKGTYIMNISLNAFGNSLSFPESVNL